METLRRDLRTSLTSLARRPGFTEVAVLTLTLGIGATGSMLTVVDAVLLSALPYREPDRLVAVAGTLKQGAAVEEIPSSHRDLADLRPERALAGLAAYSQPRSFNLIFDGEPEHATGEFVSAEYFELLGVEAALGRPFAPEEDVAPGAYQVVVVSDDLWRRRAGGSEAILGSTLTVNGHPFEVIGVAPAGFRGLTDEAELWLPTAAAGAVLSPDYLRRRGLRWLQAVGRLAPGVSREQAQAALGGVMLELEQRSPLTNQDVGVRLTPLAESWFGPIRPSLLALLGAAAAVLLIACTNVSNLLLARAVARYQELALRAALGASGRRLAGQLMLESALLALAGCVAGLLLAHWTTGLLLRASSLDLRSFVRLGVSVPVAAATVALSLIAAFALGLVPAWFAGRASLAAGLQESGRASAGPGRRRFASLLVVAEVAVALLLLFAAGVAIRGFQHLRTTDLGFETADLLTLRLDLKGKAFSENGPIWTLARQLLERVPALPAVRSAALAGPGMPTDSWYGADFNLEERTDAPPDRPLVLLFHHVSPGYFSTLGVPLRRGRDFGADDREGAPGVVIVSEEMARRSWPGLDPLGKRLRWADSPAWLSVVGVVADVGHGGLAREARPAPDIYLALLQAPPRNPPTVNLLVRTAGSSTASLVEALRREVKAIAAELPLYDVATLTERLERQTRRDRFLVLLMSLFSAIAFVLAAVGIYGLLSYRVAQLGREIGMRMALGALRRHVLVLMIRRGAFLALAGIAAGLPLALALARLLDRFVAGVRGVDPLALAGACLALLGVALLASFVPARRAAGIDPIRALRAE
jgi:predicted permease